MRRLVLLAVALAPACSLLTDVDGLGSGTTSDAGSDADASVAADASNDVATIDVAVDAPFDGPLPIGPVFSDDFDHWTTTKGPWDVRKGTTPAALTGAPSPPNVVTFLANGSLPPDAYLKKTLALGGKPQSLTCTMQVRGGVTAISGSPAPGFVALTAGQKQIQLFLGTTSIGITELFSGTVAAGTSIPRTPILSSTWEPLFIEVFATGQTVTKFAGQQVPMWHSSGSALDTMVLELGFVNPPTGTYDFEIDDVACVTE